MAARASNPGFACLMCFETRPLKIVGKCKHSFCTECLSTVFESLGSGSNVFSCPSCKADCPRPWDDLNGLRDFVADHVEGKELAAIPALEQEGVRLTTNDTRCQVCEHRNKEVQAVNLCIDCGQLHICKDCTNVHAKNKATAMHVLVPLEKEARCQSHRAVINYYCLGCDTAICTVCVMLDHGDHEVEKLVDCIRSRVGEVEQTLKQNEDELTDLRSLQEELTVLKCLVPTVDTQDTLINDIEDHAQRYIDEIIKWKEDLKKRVKIDFKIVREIPESLEKVSEEIQDRQETVNKARNLITEMEHHPGYHELLITLQKDLDKISTAPFCGGLKGKKFRDELFELKTTSRRFYPADIPASFGEFDEDRRIEDFEPIEVFKHTVQVDSKDKFIPCVANLGQLFAVAHPTKKGVPSHAIDIYEFPGALVNTLMENVYPIYDMSATPDGKLSVLSDGIANGSCCVKLFDPRDGYVGSTKDIDIDPLSLGVTLKNQYIILGKKLREQRWQAQITVVDKGGNVESKHDLAHALGKMDIPKWIKCSGTLLFVREEKQVDAYELRDSRLQMKKSDTLGFGQYITGISATFWEDIFPVIDFNNTIYVTRLKSKNYTFEWQNEDWQEVSAKQMEADNEVSVSTRDGHLVLSIGQTIRVFEI